MRAVSLAQRMCLVCRSWRSAVDQELLSHKMPASTLEFSSILRLLTLADAPHSFLSGQQVLLFAAKAKRRQQEEDESPVINVQQTLETASSQMRAALQRLDQTLSTVRTGRATPGLLDHLPVTAYGERMSLQSVAQTSVQDAQTLIVTPFDPQTLPAIEKAIVDSALNLSPKSSKTEITVPVPSPTQETLRAMAKMVKQEAEAARVAVRQARKDAVTQAKSMASEDEGKRAEAQVQKLTDQFVEDINASVKRKEDDLEKAL